MVEEVLPAQNAEVIYQGNKFFNKFDERDVLNNLKGFQKKKAQAIISEIKKQPNQLTFDTNGTVFIEGKSIPESNIKDFLFSLFNGKSTLNGFKDFVVKLQQLGLSRYIPKKSLPVEDFQPQNIVEKNPFSMEKWYFIGQ